MTQATRLRGQRGEQIAESYLRMQGFRVEARNWRMGRFGEIDLVLSHPQKRLRLFVEVKTRKTAQYGAPLDAVDPAKQEQLRLLVEVYLSQLPLTDNFAVRFDVLGIYFPGNGAPAEITQIENAL
jgi:putative endonuclease